ncbi:innexin unc-9-like [Mizuhopecten yessoensis]|uniref:Innexin n=1 Tax=Mizuhopecten yessoensis TaxID=6573 RepID=A0A210R591_MIZYE|nr:innexin unc-9-like [Mizuhopecten yessoensis]OWF56106.1 Innexin-5 [Mizuhopecten yessoensis]
MVGELALLATTVNTRTLFSPSHNTLVDVTLGPLCVSLYTLISFRRKASSPAHEIYNTMVWRPFLRHLTQSSLRLNDQCGRLNSTWTVGILVLCSLLTLYIHMAYDPVTCWTPAHFTSQTVKYTNKICWESSAYYLRNDDVNNNNEPLDSNPSPMTKPPYRWIPLILLVQALLFKLPDIVLSVGQGLVGFRFTKILGLTDGYETLNMADRAQMGRQVGRYVKSWIDSTVLKGCPWGWLTLLFLFTKLLYFINVITQLSIMNVVLKAENQTSFVQQLAEDISSNETLTWRTIDPKFLKVFLCDYSIRQITNTIRFSVQCTFNNITYYEMMFGFLWVWLMIVCVITGLSGLFHLILALVPVFRRRFVKSYLYLSEEVAPSPSDNDIAWFAGSEITEDGVCILKEIGEASSEHLVRDVVLYMWSTTHAQQIEGTRNQCVYPPNGNYGSTPETHQLQEFPHQPTRVGVYHHVND